MRRCFIGVYKNGKVEILDHNEDNFVLLKLSENEKKLISEMDPKDNIFSAFSEKNFTNINDAISKFNEIIEKE